MRITGVNFPEPLPSALRDGRLVVSASISVGSPPSEPQPRAATRQWARQGRPGQPERPFAMAAGRGAAYQGTRITP